MEGPHIPHIPDAKTAKASDVEDGDKKAMAKSKPSSTETFPLVVVDSHPSEEPIWRASIALGGMTCAACSNAITAELKKKSWIQNVVVNLISNSATVDFVGEDRKDDLVETIEDIGYDATIDSIVDISKASEDVGSTKVFNPEPH